ncbi:MAG: hypothetical protein HY961_02280 [Ignavibacteriae bacterium]|nr:hypothetical protein [Ignavibacteriota bacterium]
MAVILDMIGSVLISGYVILLILRINFNMSSASDSATTNLGIQESLVDAMSSVESDFRLAGFNVPDPKNSIAIADSQRIRIRVDLDNNNTVDSVEWYVGAPLAKYTDRQVRILYRRVNNGTPLGIAYGVTTFKLKYFDQDGIQTSVLSMISVIEVSIAVSSTYKIADQIDPTQQGYASAFWRQTRLSSRNIKRHG